MKWYVYTLEDSTNGIVFYIGKGQRYRMYNHLWSVRRGNVPHKNYKLYDRIKKILAAGGEIIHRKCFETNCENEAYKVEQELIQSFGIENLCNLYAGIGTVYSGTLHWNYGKSLSEDTRKKISKSKKGQLHSEESKAKIKLAWKQANHPRKGIKHTEESKRKMSENHADFNGTSNPFYGKTHTEDVKQKFKEMYSKTWEVTLPDGTTNMFSGRKSVLEFVKKYNEKNNVNISGFSLFQYGKNKHGWTLKQVSGSRGKWGK